MTRKMIVVFLVTAAVLYSAPTFTQKPSVAKKGDGLSVSFAVSEKTDIEVAIINSKGEVVRHLAAGVIGGKTPAPAPLKAGLSQNLEWDGKDDYGEKAKGGPFKVRVRAGMGVKLIQIVGGDPYAYYSKQMGLGDHAAWRLTGLEVKSDGKVYVLGNANNYGPAALRQYDAEGTFVKTVYPPPAGKPLEQMKAWGVEGKTDGTYALKYNDLASPALGKLPVSGHRGRIAEIVPSHSKDILLLANGSKQFKINTDGTVSSNPLVGTPIVSEPLLKGVRGPMSICYTPDRKHFFVSGIYAAVFKRRRYGGAMKDSFWRDGQVYKVDEKTRKAEVFFALDAAKVITGAKERLGSPIADAKYGPHAALQGAAVDSEGNVFVCDRQNERLLALDSGGKIIREITLKHGDAVAVHPGRKTLYVTTRFGNYHGRGELKLLKFNDWSKDTKPSITIPLCAVHHYSQRTHLAIAEKEGSVYVWVGYTALPVRVYKDTNRGLECVKDFYEAGPQRCLDVQHMAVDPKTEHVYFADGFKKAFMITDWTDPGFKRCMTGENKSLIALSVAIDVRNRLLYTHDYIRGKSKYSLLRYHLDQKFLTPAPVGNSNLHAISGKHRVSNDWRIGLGLSQRGIAVSPDGSIAALGATGHTDYSGPLYYFPRNEKEIPWKPLYFECLGKKPGSGGIRFDPAGNLYVGLISGSKWDRKIIKFTPTGKLADGNLYPTPPAGPSKVYNIEYGYPKARFSRTPRFSIDGYGRIYYPTSLVPKVSVVDNEGNSILSFGTYGNRDSMGGLEGDLVPVKGIPMIWPNSVDATDDYMYVSDIVNIRVMRFEKTFKLESLLK